MSDAPTPNAWKSRVFGPWRTVLIVSGIAAVLVGGGVLIYQTATKAQSAPPAPTPASPVGYNLSPTQPIVTIEAHTSRGGKTETKAATNGPDMTLRGDNVSASDLQLVVPIMDFDFGSIGGGSFAGSFKVSAGTARLLQWLCGLLALACAASAAVKWVGRDYVHAVGQGATAIGLALAALNPVLLGWFGFGAIVTLLVSHWFPSLAAKGKSEAEATLGSLARHLDIIAPETAKAVESSLLPEARVSLAKARAKRVKA